MPLVRRRRLRRPCRPASPPASAVEHQAPVVGAHPVEPLSAKRALGGPQGVSSATVLRPSTGSGLAPHAGARDNGLDAAQNDPPEDGRCTRSVPSATDRRSRGEVAREIVVRISLVADIDQVPPSLDRL